MPGADRCISKGCRNGSSGNPPRWELRLMATRTAPCLSVRNGKIVNGDGVLLAVARHLRSRKALKKDRVVATSMSNLGLERVLAGEGITLARAAVGDRYVLEEMLKSGNNLGGEQSGHIIFLDDSPAGDGLLTAVKVASLVSMHGSLRVASRTD